MRTNSSEYQKKNFLRKSKKMNLMVAVLSALMMLALMTTINANEAYAASAEPSISADSAIVMSASTGETVYSSHELRKMPMADSTKLMTAMIVIDNMHSATEFKNKVQITSATAGGIFKAGESVSVSDLMYAMLMSASNEAANALATYSAGSASAFVSQMNAKAQELGLTNTHYTNPTGVYDEEQYSTAADTAVITQKTFRYSRIKQMSGTVTHKIAGVTVTNTNDLLTGGTGGSLKYSGMYGGIVGHLTEPKTASTYVGIAERDDMSLIVVMLGETEASRAKDARALLDYGFKNVTRKVIVKADKNVGKVKIKHGAQTRVAVYTAGRGFVYIPPEGGKSLVKTRTVIYDNLKAPVKAGTKAGEYRIYVADELKGTVDLIVKDDVKVGWFPSYIYISNVMSVVIGFIILIVAVLLLRAQAARRRRRKKKERERKEKILEMARQQKEVEDDRKRRNWTYH